MISTAAIASAHGITREELVKSLRDWGWNFSKMDLNNADMVKFITDVVTGRAQDIAARKAAQAARQVRAAAGRIACMTNLAKANPALACGKCDGKGHMDWCSHVDEGECYWCKGTGVIRPKRAA